jgi:hypothetical protein
MVTTLACTILVQTMHYIGAVQAMHYIGATLSKGELRCTILVHELIVRVMHCFGAWMARLVHIRPCKSHAKYATRHKLAYCAVLNASVPPDSGITYHADVPLAQQPIVYSVVSIAFITYAYALFCLSI